MFGGGGLAPLLTSNGVDVKGGGSYTQTHGHRTPYLAAHARIRYCARVPSLGTARDRLVDPLHDVCVDVGVPGRVRVWIGGRVMREIQPPRYRNVDRPITIGDTACLAKDNSVPALVVGMRWDKSPSRDGWSVWLSWDGQSPGMYDAEMVDWVEPVVSVTLNLTQDMVEMLQTSSLFEADTADTLELYDLVAAAVREQTNE